MFFLGTKSFLIGSAALWISELRGQVCFVVIFPSKRTAKNSLGRSKTGKGRRNGWKIGRGRGNRKQRKRGEKESACVEIHLLPFYLCFYSFLLNFQISGLMESQFFLFFSLVLHMLLVQATENSWEGQESGEKTTRRHLPPQKHTFRDISGVGHHTVVLEETSPGSDEGHGKM